MSKLILISHLDLNYKRHCFTGQ